MEKVKNLVWVFIIFSVKSFFYHCTIVIIIFLIKTILVLEISSLLFVSFLFIAPVWPLKMHILWHSGPLPWNKKDPFLCLRFNWPWISCWLYKWGIQKLIGRSYYYPPMAIQRPCAFYVEKIVYNIWREPLQWSCLQTRTLLIVENSLQHMRSSHHFVPMRICTTQILFPWLKAETSQWFSSPHFSTDSLVSGWGHIFLL